MGISSRGDCVAAAAVGAGTFVRGRPKREGSMLRGRSLFGEEGRAEEAAVAAGRIGDSGRTDGPGEADRTTFAGD